MLNNPIVLLTLATLFSAVPIVIWLAVFFSKKEKSKKTIALVFLLGCLTAPALLGIQYLWDVFPQFNLEALITNEVHSTNAMFILTFVLFGAMEELIKMYVIKTVDQKTMLINRVNDAVKYSLVSALGFSFVENAFYLSQFWSNIEIGQFAGMYIFRSIFTTCAHMIFSGIFGYYYGIGKYSIVMSNQEKLLNNVSFMTKWIAKTFSLPLSEGYRQKTVLKGLLTAVGMHATFNFLLQFNKILPVIIFVFLGYAFLKYLLSRKAGHLVLTDDVTERASSSIAKQDKEVVIELLGMWFKDKRYVDVIHICERLLERDPDNKVVKLFKAQAVDEMEESHVYKKILGNILRSQDEMSDYDKNIVSKYISEKEEFEKAKTKIKKLLEQQGRAFIEPTQKVTLQTAAPTNSNEDTFKL